MELFALVMSPFLLLKGNYVQVEAAWRNHAANILVTYQYFFTQNMGLYVLNWPIQV